jgi:tRNA(Ile)-lysidine synthase TilS/MesJ
MNQKIKNASISKKLQREFGRTIREYGLIKENDKIIVGLSGGKDSLTLLHLIKNFQRVVPFEFEYLAVSIDYGDNSIDFTYLKKHCKEHGINYKIHQTNIMQTAQDHIRENSSFCSFFSRMRRGGLYSVCQEFGFNKLALGHHLDDAVESFFMNMIHNGTLRTMPPTYMSKYDIEVIRPLIRIREKQNINFVTTNDFLVIGNEMCPAMNFKIKMPHNLTHPHQFQVFPLEF